MSIGKSYGGPKWVILEPKGQLANHTGRPKRPQEAPRGPQDGPKRSQEAPRGPKRAPRWPQQAPRWPQQAPRRSQDGPKDEKGSCVLKFWGGFQRPRNLKIELPSRPELDFDVLLLLHKRATKESGRGRFWGGPAECAGGRGGFRRGMQTDLGLDLNRNF